MPEMPSERRINPEWQALEGKTHLVPVNCLPDQYKVIKVGTVPTNPFPSKEDPDRWNALFRWMDKHPLRFDTKGNIVETPMCPRCNRAMKRQPKGGLRCERDDCHISS